MQLAPSAGLCIWAHGQVCNKSKALARGTSNNSRKISRETDLYVCELCVQETPPGGEHPRVSSIGLMSGHAGLERGGAEWRQEEGWKEKGQS